MGQHPTTIPIGWSDAADHWPPPSRCFWASFGVRAHPKLGTGTRLTHVTQLHRGYMEEAVHYLSTSTARGRNTQEFPNQCGPPYLGHRSASVVTLPHHCGILNSTAGPNVAQPRHTLFKLCSKAPTHIVPPYLALHESTLARQARARHAGQSFPTLWCGPSSWG